MLLSVCKGTKKNSNNQMKCKKNADLKKNKP